MDSSAARSASARSARVGRRFTTISTCRRCSLNGGGTPRRALRTRAMNCEGSIGLLAPGGPERAVAFAADGVDDLHALHAEQLVEDLVAVAGHGGEAVRFDALDHGGPDAGLAQGDRQRH